MHQGRLRSQETTGSWKNKAPIAREAAAHCIGDGISLGLSCSVSYWLQWLSVFVFQRSKVREKSWPCAHLTSLLSYGCGDIDLLQCESFYFPDLVFWESPASLALQPVTEIGYSPATWLESSLDSMVPQVISFSFHCELPCNCRFLV